MRPFPELHDERTFLILVEHGHLDEKFSAEVGRASGSQRDERSLEEVTAGAPGNKTPGSMPIVNSPSGSFVDVPVLRGLHEQDGDVPSITSTEIFRFSNSKHFHRAFCHHLKRKEVGRPDVFRVCTCAEGCL